MSLVVSPVPLLPLTPNSPCLSPRSDPSPKITDLWLGLHGIRRAQCSQAYGWSGGEYSAAGTVADLLSKQILSLPCLVAVGSKFPLQRTHTLHLKPSSSTG